MRIVALTYVHSLPIISLCAPVEIDPLSGIVLRAADQKISPPAHPKKMPRRIAVIREVREHTE
eukprot:2579162-Pyramimonas_sp.AAC.1